MCAYEYTVGGCSHTCLCSAMKLSSGHLNIMTENSLSTRFNSHAECIHTRHTCSVRRSGLPRVGLESDILFACLNWKRETDGFAVDGIIAGHAATERRQPQNYGLESDRRCGCSPLSSSVW